MPLRTAVLLASLLAAHAVSASTCRDRWLEPFSSDSIWNTAIGSGASFVSAGLFPSSDTSPASFHNDQDFLVATDASTPLTKWISQGDWGPDDHCAIQGKGEVVAQIPLPHNWTSASDCVGPAKPDGSNCHSSFGQANNNAMALLMPDRETLVQMQPVYRCGFGAPLLARWGNRTDGCPQQFPNVTSILGDGMYGAHGGSGLSSIGGSIRLGELVPGAPPIQHALKLELNNYWYYGKSALNPKSDYNGGRTQYVWPATGSNAGYPTDNYRGSNKYLAPGALLAIPGSVSVATKTEIGSRVKQALTDYGGYIVDGTGPGTQPVERQLVALCMDSLVNAELRQTYGYTMTYPQGVAKGSPASEGGEVYDDLLAIFQALHVVTNNGPGSIGGGGTPRQPRKPPICNA